MTRQSGGGGCDRCREELSAALDGEADPAAARAHLAGCAACRRWYAGAAHVTRLARTSPADPAPDLVGPVLAATAPARRSARRRGLAARLALAAVGVAQVALGAAALLGSGGHGGGDGAMLGAGMAHLGHESAAWGIAVGTAFVAGAWWRRHLAGLLPALGVFIAALAALSALDLIAGRVEPTRVASHLLLVAGFVLALLVSRRGPGAGPGTAARLRARLAGPPPPVASPVAPPTLRPVRGEDPVARHEAV